MLYPNSQNHGTCTGYVRTYILKKQILQFLILLNYCTEIFSIIDTHTQHTVRIMKEKLAITEL